eukprot:7158081-Alexandrium_andersonii.AAC.1
MAAARRLSCAVLFVDVISAFYAVLRPLVLATSSVEEALWTLQKAKVSEDTVRYVADALRGTSADIMAGLSPAAISLMEASHSANWLTINGIHPAIEHNRGSIPGDPWAD